MSEIVNASGYPFALIDYRKEFEKILSKIIACYRLMTNKNVSLSNNENQIRDYILKNYLKNQHFKEQYELTNFLFDRELPENTGRIDIRVIPVNPLINDDAFYVIECKRLNAKNPNGTTGLNAEYIKEGMCRFVSGKYSSYFGVNGMIGFIVQSINISENIGAINKLLKDSFTQTNTIKELEYQEIVSNFEFSYCSSHTVNESSVILYHLMFDFSKNIA